MMNIRGIYAKLSKRRIAGYAAGLLVLTYLIGSYFGVPYSIRKMAESAPEYLNRTVTIDDVHFNPVTLRLGIRGVTLNAREGDVPLAKVASVDMRINWGSLFRVTPLVDLLGIDGMDVRVKRTGFAKFDISDLLDKYLADSPKGPADGKKDGLLEFPGFSVADISLRNSSIHLDDKVRGRVEKIDDIDFELPLICSFKDRTEDPALLALHFLYNGEPVDLSMKTIPFHESRRTGLKFTLKNLNLANLATFIPKNLNFHLKKALLDTDCTIGFRYEGDAARLHLNGNIDIHDAVVEDVRVGASMLTGFDHLVLDVTELLPFRQVCTIGKVTLLNPHATVVREADGGVNWVSLIEHPVRRDAAGESADQVASGQGGDAEWTWSVDKVSVVNGIVDVTDIASGFRGTVGKLQMTAGPLDSAMKRPVEFDGRMALLEGSASVKGNVIFDPGTVVSADVKAADLSLTPLTAFLRSFSKAAIADGRMRFEGSAVHRDGRTRVSGNLGVDRFSLKQDGGVKLASWKAFAMNGLNADFGDDVSISAESITLDGGDAFLHVERNGDVNWVKAFSPESPADKGQKGGVRAAPADKKPADKALPKIDFGKIDIVKAHLGIVDASVKPRFCSNIKDLNVSVRNFSTHAENNGQIEVSANMDGAKLSTTGSVALSKDGGGIDILAKTAVRDLSLLRFSPYSDKFTGHPVKSGSLSYSGDYAVSLSKVDTRNSLVIDNLDFHPQTAGAKNSLPMNLVVSLLKDRSGVVKLMLPVAGSFDDPEFSLFGIVCQVITNLITKAVTSPFSLLGAMFGGSDELDLNHVAFEPGTARIAASSEKAVEVVAKALAERPEIKLRLSGCATPADDEAGLKARMLDRDIHRELGLRQNAEVRARERVEVIDRLFDEDNRPGKPNARTTEEMEAYLMSVKKVPADMYRALGTDRAEVLRMRLLGQGIEASRVYAVSETEGKAGVNLKLE